MDGFDPCEVCGADTWSQVYGGDIRDGVFGETRRGAIVCECGGCGVQRLAEEFCMDDSAYEDTTYRSKLRQDLSSEKFFADHDPLQLDWLKEALPLSLRGKCVADIGCGAGNFLDHVAGIAGRTVGIEPFADYHPALKERGHDVYALSKDAAVDLEGAVDAAFSIQVIEHVSEPVAYLREIRPLMSPEGELMISTPNRADILMTLLPDAFPAFFYRVVHRWYFDAESLARCAERAGWEVVDSRHVHRFGMSNALAWLRDRRPQGRLRLDGIKPLADDLWKAYLEAEGLADTLFMTVRPAANNEI